MIGLSFIICHLSFSICACSEDSEKEGEWDNWQARNEAMTDQWFANSSLRKIRVYTQDKSLTGKSSNYIYVEVLETGNGQGSPVYTDTTRVAYRGRLIPTVTYTDGYVFDQTYIGDFDWHTAGMADLTPPTLVDGFSTALMNMHCGDHWRVHIPYQIGYGTTVHNTIPAYSDLVFEIALLDFWHPGESRPKFRARELRKEN